MSEYLGLNGFQEAQDEWNCTQLAKLHDIMHEKRRQCEEAQLTESSSSTSLEEEAPHSPESEPEPLVPTLKSSDSGSG